MTSLVCFVAISGNFGDAPIVAQLKEGKRIFEQGKGIDRTEQDARIVVGKWFDGEHIQPVEEVIFAKRQGLCKIGANNNKGLFHQGKLEAIS